MKRNLFIIKMLGLNLFIMVNSVHNLTKKWFNLKEAIYFIVVTILLVLSKLKKKNRKILPQ